MNEEKINETMKGIYDQMSNDQRERFRKIDSADGFKNFFEEEGIDLPDELLSQVSGGVSKLHKWIADGINKLFHIYPDDL